MRAEESALRDAVAVLTDIHTALRSGDLAGVLDSHHRQEAAVDVLAARPSAPGAARLAEALGLPADGVTLSALADQLPEPWAADVRAARDRIRTAAAELTDVYWQNANLIAYLRSFLHGVLSGLTAGDATVRYGRSGERVALPAGAAILARG